MAALPARHLRQYGRAATERARLRVGFRSIAVDEAGVLRVNGRRMVLRGVNGHEFDPHHGRTLSREVMCQDVELNRRPFLLTEFAHAMGTGPAGLAEYLQLCSEYPRVQGGYVWEWNDQGLRTRDARGPSSLTTTAAASARICTAATSPATAWSSPTALPRPASSSTRR
ncbi:glycoside hydrolase family 2 TIM barrel-domain containing protein [Streptomyces sp. A1547]|uniref:glycoside hydrolase family 2 TIM barrel-domain containing protein n=1 Tax=Streptomyces sp. A1547 TaxID=2563105 RepID=UPI001F0D10E9|nr:glycoside hydrolase family 2 TIM barrel-domain containing protein [Streptomyces sp. A1547]